MFTPNPSLFVLRAGAVSSACPLQALTHCGSPSHRSQNIGHPVSGWRRRNWDGQASMHLLHLAPRHVLSSMYFITLVSLTLSMAFGLVGQALTQGESSQCQQITATSTIPWNRLTCILATAGRTLPLLWYCEQAYSQERHPVHCSRWTNRYFIRSSGLRGGFSSAARIAAGAATD